MSDEIYLEPCPFCGGRAEIIDALEAGPQAYVVCCRGCMASSRVIYAIKDDVTFDLSSAWNTRADTAAAQVAAAYERAADLCVDQFQAHLDLVITGNPDNARNRESAANMAEKLSHEIRALATDTQTDALEQVRKEADRAGYERLRAKADKLAGAVNQYVRKHNATAFRTADYHENCDCLRCLFDRMSAALTELENTDDQNT